MSRDRKPASVRPGQAPRVLVLVNEGLPSPTSDALTAAGCDVETVSRVSDLAGRVADMAPDAVLFELAGGKDRQTGGSEIQRGLASLANLDAALREIEQLRQTVAFARAKAHDLAQPLTTILARSQLLMNSLKPEDPHYRAISIICAEAERLADAAAEFNKLKAMAAESSAQKA